MKKVVIPREVDRITSYSFAGAEDLQSITIPSTVSYIAKDAFRDCRHLAAIYCEFGAGSVLGVPWGAPKACRVYYNRRYEDKNIANGEFRDTSDATATASDILYPATAYSKGEKLTGNIPTISPTFEGNTVTVPVGYNPKKFTVSITDTSGATVTADKMLDGVKAVNVDGELITGTIKTVTASLSDNVVTVPAGHIADEQTLTVAIADEPSVADNKVTINKGYVAEQKVITIAEAAAPTVTDNIVTINKGYQEAQTVTISEAAEPTVSGNEVTINKGYNKEQKTVTVPEMTVQNDGEKVVIPVGYNKTEQQISISSGIDTSDATATAEQMLDGATAYADGKKVTGNIKTVTATLSGNVTTVPKGYIAEKQTLTVPEVTPTLADNVVTVPQGYIPEQKTLTVAEMTEPTLSANVVTIAKGYNKAQKTVTVPEASISETDTDITVGVGYIGEAQTFEKGKELPKVTVTASKMLEGVTAINSSGEVVTGTIPAAEPGDWSVQALRGTDGKKDLALTFTMNPGYVRDYISFNTFYKLSEVGIPDAELSVSGNTVTVSEGYTPGDSIEVSLPDVTVTADKLLSGTTAINTAGEVVTGTIIEAQVDEAFRQISRSEDNAYVVAHFTKDGFVEGGKDYIIPCDKAEFVEGADFIEIYPGLVDRNFYFEKPTFFQVTEYIAPHDAYAAVGSVEVSGFGEADCWGEMQDFSAWNGTYNVTPASARETSTEARVYKHATQEKYLFRMYCNDNGEYYWVFNTSPSANYVYDADFHADKLSSGTWRNYEYEFEVSLTIKQNTVNYPAQELVLNGFICSWVGSWNICEEASATWFEKTPQRWGVYLYGGEAIFGNPIAYIHENTATPEEGLLCFFPMDDTENVVDVVNGMRLVPSSNAMYANDDVGWECASMRQYLKGFNTAFDLPQVFTLAVKARIDAVEGSFAPLISFGQYGEDTGMEIQADKDEVGWRINTHNSLYDGGHRIPYTAGEEHFWVMTFNGSAVSMYKDGEIQKPDPALSATSYSFDDKPKTSRIVGMFSRRFYDDGNESFTGKISFAALWNRVLTEDEIATLVQS